jgi:DNA-binding SARP family transcriptional activator
MSDTARLAVHLFGRFSVEWRDHNIGRLDAAKVQELFSYLLVHRERAHARTVLASLLWADCPQAQAQKYLRQTLWQLQSALSRTEDALNASTLVIEPEWIRLNPKAMLDLDVAVLENAFQSTSGVRGEALPDPSVDRLRHAIHVYRGDLLEGWHQDWCLGDRERLQSMYLGMLNKLMAHAEAHNEYEAGVLYGETVLRYDRAHERTHRRLMRLHYLAGDRTTAIRQFRQCSSALQEELGVKPSSQTMRVYEQIQHDDFGSPGSPETPNPRLLQDLLERLRLLRVGLAELESHLQAGMQREKPGSL